MKKMETIFIGIGETEDPLPHDPKITRYWVHAGPCEKCSCGGREIAIEEKAICLICEECCGIYKLPIEVEKFFDVSYVYWCNRAKFASDEVVMSSEDLRQLEELAKDLEPAEIPRWAVVIIGGKCSKTSDCINYKCRYNAEKGGN